MQQREKRHLGGLEETQKWEFLGTACPDVDAEGVCEGGRCLGVSLGVAVMRRVGSFGFLSEDYSQNCIWLKINFFQNTKQKK